MTARQRWSTEDLERLIKFYPDTSTAEIAKQLGRSMGRVYSKAAALGLKKSEDYLASPTACRLRRGDNVGAGTRFKPGHSSWNKGTKGIHTGGEATQFKKGHRRGRALEVYQPVGAERISKDGYRQRKVNDDLPLQKRWRAVHLIVWEEANGPLPKGCAVVFKDRDRTNIDIGNLEMITRRELMLRNTVHNYPLELRQVIRLKGVLTRKINQRGGPDERRND